MCTNQSPAWNIEHVEYTLFKYDCYENSWTDKTSRLLIDEATVISIGIYLNVEQSVIQSCIRDTRDSIQLDGYHMLMEWMMVRRSNVNYKPFRQYLVCLIPYVTGMELTDQTNDLDALKSILRHTFEENNMVDPFMKINSVRRRKLQTIWTVFT